MPAKPRPRTDATTAELAILAYYRPAPRSARHDGWTAGRQWRFQTLLAETGRTSQGMRPVEHVVAFRLVPAPARRRRP